MLTLRSIPSHRLAEVTASSICILKPSSFGDIVQSLPLLPALRHRFPQARVSWVVKREWADLLAGHPDLDEVILFDSRAAGGSGCVCSASFAAADSIWCSTCRVCCGPA